MRDDSSYTVAVDRTNMQNGGKRTAWESFWENLKYEDRVSLIFFLLRDLFAVILESNFENSFTLVRFFYVILYCSLVMILLGRF